MEYNTRYTLVIDTQVLQAQYLHLSELLPKLSHRISSFLKKLFIYSGLRPFCDRPQPLFPVLTSTPSWTLPHNQETAFITHGASHRSKRTGLVFEA